MTCHFWVKQFDIYKKPVNLTRVLSSIYLDVGISLYVTSLFALVVDEACEDIHIPICQRPQQRNYNQTHLPNYFGHMTQEEATLHTHAWSLAISLQCHEQIQPFLCALYGPACHAPDNYW